MGFEKGRSRVLLPAGVALAMLSACGGGDSGGSGSAGLASSVSVSITDAPVEDAQGIFIKITGVAFKPEGSAPELVKDFAPRTLNLLEYQQGRTAVLLDKVPFEPGRYQWIRLIIESEPNVRDSYAMVNGQECELRVPSGAESGLKLNRGLTVPAAGSLALTLDFDLRRSLRAPPGQRSGTAGACTQGYQLRPTIRLVDDANVGAFAGTVTFAGGSVPAGCMPKVYVYEGNVTPDDDEDGSAAGPDVDPVTVIGVVVPEGATSGTYRAAFLPAGSYTAAFTCGNDDPVADDALAFTPAGGVAVTVQNNLIATQNFSVPVPAAASAPTPSP
ncbi:MAG: DUF4382 domain-containing protein [Steroidobacteraceae bacterium]|jgi:hypothetical protein|nr:DUF4382 domain-containing protein [Steroidobacteraceae bacterium]